MASASSSTGDKAITTKFTLNNGTIMPSVGFGTFRIKSEETMIQVVDTALAEGYRAFDTAAVYHNESHLKTALTTLLPKYGLTREDIFVTTKLSNGDHGASETVHRAYTKSLQNLGLDYADLYLMHFPGTQNMKVDDIRNKVIRQTTWSSMVELYDNGLVNAIGVSNFTVGHLKQLMKNIHGVIPVVNQVEMHPFYPQTDLLEYCQQNDILVQAYGSLGGTSSKDLTLITHPEVTKIARKLDVTNGQLLLRWGLQQDVAIIPKAINPVHIKENIQLNFIIPNEDMIALSNLGKVKQIKYAWDPSVVI